MTSVRTALFPIIVSGCVADVVSDTFDTSLFVPTTTTTAVGTPTGMTSEPVLTIAGSYVDQWGTEHSISDEMWTQSFGTASLYEFNITQFDNDAQSVIAQNGPANAYNPDQWSRFDWHDDGMSGLWYCQTSYAASTEQEALDTTAADAADLAYGCGGFGWTNLTP